MKRILNNLLVLGMLGILVLTGCRGNNNDNGGSAPGAPQNPSATAGDGSVTIQWSAVEGATSYNIYWSTTAGVTKATGTKIEGATSPYAHTGLTNGTTYCYVVTAVNGAGESAESAEVSATPQAPIPGVPQNPSATAGPLSATVKWDSVVGATSYNIYWSNTAGVTKANGTKIPNATSPYQHNSLTPVTTYYYVVTAVNATGESAASAQVSAAVPSNAKGITAFSFANPAATGTINESAKTVSLTVPNGTNVTELVATFTTTGANVKVDSTVQVSGTTPNNFTSSVAYVVTAADGTTATYTVTVTRYAGVIAIPKTGQVASYSTTTTQDDGSLQKGAAWPSPRFTDNGDGTIADRLTGLVWLKDANCMQTSYGSFDTDDVAGDGSVNWQSALDFIAGINAGTYSNCGAGKTDWRLPNINELRSLVDYAMYAPALPVGYPFINVQGENYWSSTTDANNSLYAFSVSMYSGLLSTYAKTLLPGQLVFVWPVRPGQTENALTSVPKTGQVVSYSTPTTYDDGALQKGVSWPSTRFTDNGDGTVADSLTGLVWLKDGNCMQTNYGGFDTDGTAGDGLVKWQHALDFIAGINNGTYANCGAGKTDWRLPNANELLSLAHEGYKQETCGGSNCSSIADWLNTLVFTQVQATGSYWTSTTYSGNSPFAYRIDMIVAGLNFGIKNTQFGPVWPVRGGQ